MKPFLQKKVRALIPTLAFLPSLMHANNLSIGDITLVDTDGGEADIQFTMSWGNSSRETWTETGDKISGISKTICGFLALIQAGPWQANWLSSSPISFSGSILR